MDIVIVGLTCPAIPIRYKKVQREPLFVRIQLFLKLAERTGIMIADSTQRSKINMMLESALCFDINRCTKQIQAPSTYHTMQSPALLFKTKAITYFCTSQKSIEIKKNKSALVGSALRLVERAPIQSNMAVNLGKGQKNRAPNPWFVVVTKHVVYVVLKYI